MDVPSTSSIVVLYAPTRGSDHVIPSLLHACPPCWTFGTQRPGSALTNIYQQNNRDSVIYSTATSGDSRCGGAQPHDHVRYRRLTW